MKALIIIDMQNDFMPWGALPVKAADKLISNIKKCIPHFSKVIATQDWHPANHVSFAINHGKRPGEETTLRDGQIQKLWPVHCVAQSQGADLVLRLQEEKIDKLIQKGTDFKCDSYSAFFDNARAHQTELQNYLKQEKITELYFAGVATEYCVAASILDALSLGFTSFLIEDACGAVDEEDAKKAKEQIIKQGGNLIHTSYITGS